MTVTFRFDDGADRPSRTAERSPIGARRRPGAAADAGTSTLDPGASGAARSALLGPLDDTLLGADAVALERCIEPAKVTRGTDVGDAAELQVDADAVLAIDTVDGVTLYARAGRLHALALAHAAPARTAPMQTDAPRVDEAADDSTAAPALPLPPFAPSDHVRHVAVLRFGIDALVREAAARLAGASHADPAAVLADWPRHARTPAGTRALLEALDARATPKPGLHLWGTRDDTPALLDVPAATLRRHAAQGMLLLLHGTLSDTQGTFGALRSDGARESWAQLTRRFEGAVYGFDHATLACTPIDNALALVEALPEGARLSMVAHGRGGFVGDLLALAAHQAADTAAAIERHHRTYVLAGDPDGSVRAQHDAHERGQLAALVTLLRAKRIQVQRYLRVATPAAGIAALGDNLNAFLAALCWLRRDDTQAPARALRRLMLEAARHDIDVRNVPGLEVLLPGAPLQRVLDAAPRAAGLNFAVMTAEAAPVPALDALLRAFAGWLPATAEPGDLLVSTESALAGPFAELSVHLAQGLQVQHLRYFADDACRGALCDWLLAAAPAQSRAFATMRREVAAPVTTRAAAGPPRTAAGVSGKRPVVILLPGTMGTHLAVPRSGAGSGALNRIWMDPVSLAAGGLQRIGQDAPDVRVDGLFGMFYGALSDHLAASHDVVEFGYDWRVDITGTARRLDDVVGAVLARAGTQPVRFLAHSMGGLVVRCFAATAPARWRTAMGRNGARFVMLGTPNNGSHLMVETLLGKGKTIRMLAALDQTRGLKALLEIVARFEGVLQLLPRADFADTDASPTDYLDPARWSALQARSGDWWFGDRLAPTLPAGARKRVAAFWKALDGAPLQAFADKVLYVAGHDDATPSGVRTVGDSVKMLATGRGDGSVTWQSGLTGATAFIAARNAVWYMPVPHGDLAGTPAYFADIDALLTTGRAKQLAQQPPAARSVSDAPRVYDAPPPPRTQGDALYEAIMPRRRRPAAQAQRKATLEVSVHAIDVRFAARAVFVGHYENDAIAGPLSVLDQDVLDGALARRFQLGEYMFAGALGTNTIVLARDEGSGTTTGAVVVGLGPMDGSLGLLALTESTRAAAVRLLLQWRERYGEPSGASIEDAPPIAVASLLVGSNSTSNVAIQDSVLGILLGIARANHEFREVMHSRLRIGDVRFVEMFLDTAHSAVMALRDVHDSQGSQFERLGAALRIEPTLVIHDSARQRVFSDMRGGYWPRIVIANADADAGTAAVDGGAAVTVAAAAPAPAVSSPALQSPAVYPAAPADGANDTTQALDDAGQPAPPTFTWDPSMPVAGRLKFTYLGTRARAETIVRQRQPGLLEAIVAESIVDPTYREQLSRTLFQLMVPLEFKSAARQADQLMLVLDDYTANLPWEMLRADDEPMVCNTVVMRQLATPRFRAAPRTTVATNALVLADPETSGFDTRFVGPHSLPPLAGAREEGQRVAKLLGERFAVSALLDRAGFTEVIDALYERPLSILHIAAHGDFNRRTRDGQSLSGVVLSNGMFLTAAEIGQMEFVPDLVFLNCCHSGKGANVPNHVNRLAYGVARELIDMGVRCVIAAGWAVDDRAALRFSDVFYTRFVADGDSFASAVHAARRAVYSEYPNTNTWGAYQAYGDPQFVLGAARAHRGRGLTRQPVSAQEVVDRLNMLRVSSGLRGGDGAQARPRNAALYTEAKQLLAAAGPWANGREVLYAFAEFAAQLGGEHLKEAADAYARAIAAYDRRGGIPLRAFEQLWDVRSSWAELASIGASGRALADVLDVAERAAHALDGLRTLLKDAAAGSEVGDDAYAGERSVLHASAFVRLAAVRARQPNARWRAVAEDLAHARARYRSAAPPAPPAASERPAEREGPAPPAASERPATRERPAAREQLATQALPLTPDVDPIAHVRALQLDALLQTRAPSAETTAGAAAGARAAADEAENPLYAAARARHQRTGDYRDGIAAADAFMARALRAQALDARQGDAIAEYRKVFDSTPVAARGLDETVRWLRMLARLFAFAAQHGRLPASQAEALRAIADVLDPVGTESAPEPASETDAATAHAATAHAPRPRTRSGAPAGVRGQPTSNAKAKPKAKAKAKAKDA